jgi:STE24 endopeptidase
MAQGFDPAAATAAYLALLPPEAHAKAAAYTQGGHWLLLWGALVAVLTAWLVLRSGVLVGLRTRIESRKARPWLAVLAVVLVDSVLEAILALPWNAYSDWWRERSYGLTSQGFGAWLAESAMMLALTIPISVLLVAGLYALMRRTPRTWWVWGGALVSLFFVIVLVLAPVFAAPLFNTYKEAPPGPIRDSIVELAKVNGVPSDKIYIYDGSKQSNRYTANVSGVFGTAQIAMSDVMFAKGADLAEVRGVVGHEMGHYVYMHTLWAAASYGLMALAAFFLVDRLFPHVLAWTGAKGVTGLSDPAGFPVIAIILAVLGLLATPLYAGVTRINESIADRFSLEHANEPDGLSRALVKTIEYRAATPSKLEETLFYTHPAVGSRIRRAMEWKAAQMKVDEVR